jgi:hypothetical protein
LNRCDTLKLEGGYSGSDEQYEYKVPRKLATLQFPLSSSLRCLYVQAGWEITGIVQKLLVACNHESTALRELSIDDPDYCCHAGDRALIRLLADHQFLLERLTSFSAVNIHFPANVIAAMPRLSYFSYYGSEGLPPLCSTAYLLQEVHLRKVGLDTRNFGTRPFGNLRKLVLRECWLQNQREIKLPVLDTLIFEGVSWLPVLMLDCPSLLNLELTWGASPPPFGGCTRADTESEVIQLWSPKQRFAYLKTLKIDMWMSDTALITILRNSVALELLVITIWSRIQTKSTPGEILFSDLLLENFGRPGFVPTLRTLILRLQEDIHDSTACDVVYPVLSTGMERVVRSRPSSAPLWRASLEIFVWNFFKENPLIVVETEDFVVCEEEQGSKVEPLILS